MKILAGVLLVWVCAVSFFWSMSVIIADFGYWGGLIAFLFAPVMVVFAPLYVGFSTGDWALCAMVYGGSVAASLLIVLVKDEGNE